LTTLQAIARLFARSGNLHEQIMTVMSMLEPLVAVGAVVQAAQLCGALSRTPWAATSAFRLIDRTVAAALPSDTYNAARRTGALLPASDLVEFVFPLVDEATGASSGVILG
jgi:hypothetical protein